MPNQWFDTLLRHRSHGCVLVVTHMYMDAFKNPGPGGRPLWRHLHHTPASLAQDCGIDWATAKKALEEAEHYRFITCVRRARHFGRGVKLKPSVYTVRFTEDPAYVADPERFDGFVKAEHGCRFPVPKAFFDHTVPSERHGVVKVVGSIIRATAGWVDPYFGKRALTITLSLSKLEQRTGLARRHLVEALREAMERGHLRIVRDGYFDPNAGRDSRAVTYGLNWLLPDGTPLQPTQLDEVPYIPLRPEPIEGEVRRKGTGSSSEKGNREVRRKGTGEVWKKGTGSSEKGNREVWKKGTGIKNNDHTEIEQQQGTSEALVGSAAAELVISSLVGQGIGRRVAGDLARRFPAAQIRRQIDWLPGRPIRGSRTGYLIRAIENDYGPPKVDAASSPTATFVASFYAALAGNAGTPVARASGAELAAAEGFLRQLAACSSEVPEALGRAFGAYVAGREGSTPSQYRTFLAGLRKHGDEFLSTQQREQAGRARDQAAARKRALEAAQEAHQARFAVDYARYLDQAEKSAQEGNATAWSAFLEAEATARAKIAENSVLSGIGSDGLKDRMLTHFDSPAERGRRLHEFFADSPTSPVLGFWAWDAQMNPERFRGSES